MCRQCQIGYQYAGSEKWASTCRQCQIGRQGVGSVKLDFKV